MNDEFVPYLVIYSRPPLHSKYEWGERVSERVRVRECS